VKLKRRDMLMAAVASTSLTAQQAPAQEDLLALARRSMEANREAIRKVEIPMAAEPAFSFKA